MIEARMKRFIKSFLFFLFGALQEDWSKKSADEKAYLLGVFLFVVPVLAWMGWVGKQNYPNGPSGWSVLGVAVYAVATIVFRKYIKKKLS